MSTTAIILIVAALIAVAAGIWMAYRRKRAAQLKAQFGPEYTHAVQEYGTETRAQDALAARARRMEKIHVRPLAREEHDRFLERWETVQRGFVDDPGGAIQQADGLVKELMTARGYPLGDFDHRAEDVSVDHPQVVQNYRAAHAIAQRHKSGEAGTEDLRQGLVHYRALFDELLEGQFTEQGRIRR